jgi:lipoate---protein ligase
MLIVKNLSTNPYFNLAAEEHLLKNFDEDIFMLWRNENAIVVGKHQNTLAEINLNHVLENKIDVVRRLSGGGTVFHDLGNLNFTFIANSKHGEDIKIDFKYFTAPIIEVLQKMNIPAAYSGRNDLLINGQKFSGNAEHIYHQKKRTLHHGTLLFSSNIPQLSAALKSNPLQFEDKAVKSVRSRVTNINAHLAKEMSVMEFYELVVSFMAERYENVKFYEFNESDIKTIHELAESKYKTWEWNFAYSPKYTFKKSLKTVLGTIDVELYVEKGLIETASLKSDYLSQAIVSDIIHALIKTQHQKAAIKFAFENANLNFDDTIAIDEMIEGLF